MTIDPSKFKSNQVGNTVAPKADTAGATAADQEQDNVTPNGETPYDYTKKLKNLTEGRPQTTAPSPSPDADPPASFNPFDLWGEPQGRAASAEVRTIHVPTPTEIFQRNSSADKDIHLSAVEARYLRLIDGLAIMKQNWIHSTKRMTVTEQQFANARIDQIELALSKAKQYLGQVQNMIEQHKNDGLNEAVGKQVEDVVSDLNDQVRKTFGG